MATTRIQPKLDEKTQVLTITVNGAFDYDSVYAFRAAYEGHEVAPREVVVDLRQTEAIDSAALGMLLNMKRNLGLGDQQIRIINAPADVRRVLEIARFDKKFRIE